MTLDFALLHPGYLLLAADAADLRPLARRACAEEGGGEDTDREGEGGVGRSGMTCERHPRITSRHM